MEDLVLYAGATIALRYLRHGIFGRPERRLVQQVAALQAQEALELPQALVLAVPCGGPGQQSCEALKAKRDAREALPASNSPCKRMCRLESPGAVSKGGVVNGSPAGEAPTALPAPDAPANSLPLEPVPSAAARVSGSLPGPPARDAADVSAGSLSTHSQSKVPSKEGGDPLWSPMASGDERCSASLNRSHRVSPSAAARSPGGGGGSGDGAAGGLPVRPAAARLLELQQRQRSAERTRPLGEHAVHGVARRSRGPAGARRLATPQSDAQVIWLSDGCIFPSEAASHALYHHPDDAVKKQAGAWLEAWQRSLDAWSTSDAVLHDSSSTVEAQYFCAITLRTKVQLDYDELPAGAAASLRDSLVGLLLRYARGSRPTRTQLCLALAALAAHLPAAEWGGGGAVQWLAGRMSGEPSEAALPCMLEVLTVLPQEAGSYRPAVRPERRRAMVAELVSAVPAVLQVLATCLELHHDRSREQVLEAFGAWLRVAAGSAHLDGAALAAHPLTAAALAGLQESETFDAAVEAVCELVFCTASGGQPEAPMLPLVQRLVPAVLELRPRFAVLAQREAAERSGGGEGGHEGDDDIETAKGIARLFAEVGEAYTALIAAGAPEAMRPVEALLEVGAFPDDSIAAMSFNFWHRLARYLTSGFSPQSLEDASSAEETGTEEGRRRLAVFVPAFERMVALVRGRVRLPDNWDALHSDEQKDFKRNRFAVGDTLLDAASVLGAEKTLELLLAPLQEAASAGSGGWRTIEAGLYCVRAIHRTAPPVDNALLLGLFGGLRGLPEAPILRYTAAMMVSAYAQWLARSLRAGAATALLPDLLQLLTTALGDREACPAAALALRHLCEAAPAHLARYADALLGLYARVAASGPPPIANGGLGTALGAWPMSGLAGDEEDVLQVVEGVAHAVSALPAEQRRSALEAMVAPLVQPLQAALVAPGGREGPLPSPPASAALVVQLVDRLTVVFRFVADPEAVAAALGRVWGVFEAALARFHNDERTAEHLCRAPRYALRTAGAAAAGLVPALAGALPRWFAATRHGAFLYVASELVKVFGGQASLASQLGELLARLLGEACSRLRNLREVSDAPDLADDTFLLAGRALHYAPALVLQPLALLPALLDSAAAGLLVQHREACCSTLTFVARLFDADVLARCPPEVAQQATAAMAPRTPGLVRLLVAGAVGALPAGRTGNIADVLFSVLKATQQQGVQWLADAVGAIPDESAPAADRKALLVAASATAAHGQAADSSKSLEDAVEDLSELVRRSRRAQEAALRALLPGELLPHFMR
ncbi:hypothetical protein WJX81_001986 [Elliptochloris bilobata]|uniref:Importin N-terminal domain-containing protein n=1 Tax=Elliptochloris bilobata TaxID=381761 RepID=A0AAW1R1J7_9CHLO